MKKKILWGVIIVLSILTIVGKVRYQYLQEERIRERERVRKLRYVMFTMGYGNMLHDSEELSYDEQYSINMLNDSELPVRIEYLNYYMHKEFSNDEYEDITIEELENSPLEMYERFVNLSDDLEEDGKHMQYISTNSRIQIFEDREYMMTIFGYENLLKDYAESLHSEEYYKEKFLADGNLPVRLEKLNQVIKTELSGQYEEIAIERIINDQLKVVEELHEIEQIYPDIRSVLLQS